MVEPLAVEVADAPILVERPLGERLVGRQQFDRLDFAVAWPGMQIAILVLSGALVAVAVFGLLTEE